MDLKYRILAKPGLAYCKINPFEKFHTAYYHKKQYVVHTAYCAHLWYVVGGSEYWNCHLNLQPTSLFHADNDKYFSLK